jgi:hypothetical protein
MVAHDGASVLDAARADAGPVVAPPGGPYRYAQRYLFQPAEQAVYPSRLADGADLPGDRFGPTTNYVSAASGWPWDRPGGDWIDADRVRYGNNAWASVLLTEAVPHRYELDVTQLVQFTVTEDRWLAVLLQCEAPRTMATFTSTDHPAPSIAVRYMDGTEGVLRCRVCAPVNSGSAYPLSLVAESNAPLVVEFDRAAGAVSSATLQFTNLRTFFGGDPTLRVFLLDPPVNAEPVQEGVASAAALDAGLPSHPSIFGAHRILDGTRLEDFVYTGPIDYPNFNAVLAYDPALYGRGPQNLARLPHLGLGKWIGAPASGPNPWSLVSSDYRMEGFQPLRPGIAAIRVPRPREVAMDDVVVGYATSQATLAKLFMPPAEFGRLGEIYCRYYVRLGTSDGGPYIHDNSTRYQVRNAPGNRPVWTDCGGKTMIMPAHDTTPGGVSGTSGGGRGWQMRMGWADVDLASGPDTGGWVCAPHFFDYLTANPPGHNYGAELPARDVTLAQRGGLGGLLYAHHWYCYEVRMKMNSVDQPAVLADGSPHVIDGVRQYWTPDGALEIWIDGRLAYQKTGMVFRTLPLNSESYAGRENIYVPPTGNLGIRDLWFNWFHGGLTQSSRSRVMFFTGLAWGREYIGPMRFA